jgi:hypothetical protein
MWKLRPGRGQERGQRGQQLLGSLLGDPVAAAWDDQGLHVVGDQLHEVADHVTGAFPAADGQDGHGQPPGLALLVLRGDGGERPVDLEAAAQGVGVGGEAVDVVTDGAGGELGGPGRGGELGAEEDGFPSPDQGFVDLGGELVEGEVPEPGVERRGKEQRRGGRDVWEGASDTTNRSSRSG